MLWNLAASGYPPFNINTERDFLTFAQFGVLPSSPDNSTALQTAFNTAAAMGRWLQGGIGTYSYSSTITIPAGLKLRGSSSGVTRLEKNFTTTGSTAAGLVSANLVTSGSDNVIIRRIEIGAVAHKLGGVDTNKPMLLRGNNIILDQVHIKTWSGFGVLAFGNNHQWLNCSCEDPLIELGNDGFHFGGGDGLYVDGLSGISADDFLAIATPLTGNAVLKNQNITNYIVKRCTGISLLARGFFTGVWEATLTCTVENGRVEDSDFTGAATTGAVYLANIASGGTLQNIKLLRVTCRGNLTALTGVSIRGGGTMANIDLEECPIYAGTDHALQILGPFGVGAIRVYGSAPIDGTGGSKSAVNVPTAAGSKGLYIHAPVVCGAEHGLNLASGVSILDEVDLVVVVTQVPDGFAALNCNAMEDSVIDITATKKAGATTSIGVKEGANSARNIYTGNVTGVDDGSTNISGTSNVSALIGA